MCLITEQLKPLIAEKDIIVYKRLTKDFFPCYFTFKKNGKPFKYELNKLYKTNIKLVPSLYAYEWTAFNGKDLNWLKKDYGNSLSWAKTGKLICISKGFHASKKLSNIGLEGKSNFLFSKVSKLESCRQIVVKCTIPKGATYYVNRIGLTVSNQIIINKKIS